MNTTLIEAYEEFVLALAVDGLAASTLRWYKSLVTRFVETLGTEFPVIGVTSHVMRKYLLELRSGGYSEDTVADHTRSLHKFFKFVAAEYELKNPMRTIAYPQPPKNKAPKAVAIEDVEAMLLSARDGNAPERDIAIIVFALDTGARAAGIVGLQVKDVDLQKRQAKVTEKGDKTRNVVFTELTAQLIVDWLKVREPANTLFYAVDTLEPLTVNGLYQLFRRLARRAGIKGKFNPHAFRHAFALGYLMNGGDLASLTRLLGHTDPKTTMHYLVQSEEELANAHGEFSPVPDLKIPKILRLPEKSG